MLGFLRRKDKRARAATPTSAPQAAPLRDRNTPTNNARLRAAAAAANASASRSNGHAHGYSKENAGVAEDNHRGVNPKGAADHHPRRKMRTPIPPQAPSSSSKEKVRRGRFNKHEPAVNTKVLTNDRRKSYKASPDAYPEPPAAPTAPTHRRRPSGDKSLQAQAQPHAQPPPQQTTWPHHDLMNALRRDDIQAADMAVRRLAHKAMDNNNGKLRMVREGVAQALINMLKHERANLSMRRSATAAIAEFAVLDQCEQQLVAAGTVPVLVWLINPNNNTDRHTLASACRALRNLLGGSAPTAVQAAKYGCVEPLLRLIDGRSGRPEENDVVPEATAALANLAHHGYRFQSYVIKHQGLESLNKLGTRTRNEEALYHIVSVLAEFARTEKWQSAIVAAGGLSTAMHALKIAKDVEVVCEAARLIGNVAVTKKSRGAVRDAGGAASLIARLALIDSYQGTVPTVDLCSAIANVCTDPRAASDALMNSDAAGVLLRVYTDMGASSKCVIKAKNALCVFASGSVNRRARVLYAIGNELRQDASRPAERLYDLRQAILEEDADSQVRQPNAPENLERLSRASMRLMNSGVAPHGRSGPPPSTKPPRPNGLGTAGRSESPHAQQLLHQQAQQQYPERPEYAMVKKERSKFRSTGRVLSVAQPRRPRAGAQAQLKQRIERQQQQLDDDDDDYALPRANEQALADDAESRRKLLVRETDGNFEKQFFEVGQQLGKGGYGSVFMAKDLRSGELVAIKQFHQSGALVDKKALKEQRIWKGLHHSNVVEFKGSFVGDNDSLNLVVEYVDGLSLADHLSQYSAFPETLVAEITRQVLQGLEYLHANGVTHRDLKPANILVDGNASVKICDFGVSRSENVQTINPGQQHMVGTPWYIAPEMIEYRPYTTSVDIWSLGCTVLELATGRRPYHELSAMQVLFRMVEDRRPPIAQHLSPECQSFLHSCWIWDPEERPSASTLLKHPFIASASIVRRSQ